MEFWRRWHISLSTWLRDYIYIPLGGNRKGAIRQYFNQMITMLIGGAWHGASMSFIAWGGLHGVALCVHKYWSRSHKMLKLAAWIVTMLTVILGWILFRADTFSQAWTYIYRMMTIADGFHWMHPHVLVAILILVVSNIRLRGGFLSDFHDVRTPGGFFVVVTLFSMAILYPSGSTGPFIYSQF